MLYTSDHGDMMGEHGLWFKNSAYEWSSRVPWIVAGPGVASRRIPEAVSLLDLGPTLASMAGVEPVYPVTDGRDLAELIAGRRAPGPGLAIMENYGEGVWRGWRTIRRGDWKLTYVPGYEPELFNLSDDPGEWRNRAADPACTTIRADLEARILDNWDPDACDEARWQSEERRLAILKCPPTYEWQTPSPPVPHPLWPDRAQPIDNVST